MSNTVICNSHFIITNPVPILGRRRVYNGTPKRGTDVLLKRGEIKHMFYLTCVSIGGVYMDRLSKLHGGMRFCIYYNTKHLIAMFNICSKHSYDVIPIYGFIIPANSSISIRMEGGVIGKESATVSCKFQYFSQVR
jgi:hypothetical protein